MSAALDVAIGVVFLYLLLALLVTTVQELIASVLRMRAKHLYAAIGDMLEEGGQTSLTAKLYAHPLIRNLTDQDVVMNGDKPSVFGGGMPSYIPSRTFALALLDVLRQERGLATVIGASNVLAEAVNTVKTLPDGRLKSSLQLLIGDAHQLATDVDERSKLVSARIEAWFNDRMARASGWYKRNAQFWSLVIAGSVTVVANADSLHVINRLWDDSALRAAVVASAQAYQGSQEEKADASTPSDSSDTSEVAALFVEQMKTLESSGLPIGWSWTSTFPCPRLEESTKGVEADPKNPTCWSPGLLDAILLVAGWIITTLAVSLGAAFWFDILSKALQLRGSGGKVSMATGKVEAGAE